MLRLITVFLTMLLLTSCGFTLRGTAELPASLQPLHLTNSAEGSLMSREMTQVMTSNKIALTDKPAANGYSLTVSNETSKERAVSVNANARAGEYEIIMSVSYQLKRGDKSAMQPQTVSLNKVYLADPDNAVAKTEEADIIRGEMRHELAQLILRQLQAFVP